MLINRPNLAKRLILGISSLAIWLFLKNDRGRIMHVGIILPNSEIIHSSSKVHVDCLDEKGIFNYKTKEYTHKLRIIKTDFVIFHYLMV